MNRTDEASLSEDQDARLAALLDAMIASLRSGDPLDVEEIARQNPDLADELLSLWGTVRAAEGLARPSCELAETTDFSPRRKPLPPPIAGCIGDCEVLEEIGRGGMGAVYRARQEGLGRVVALKILLRGSMAGAHDVARFRSEAASASRLDHPHIVPVYAVGDHEGQPYFLMRLIEGETLARRLATGPIPPRAAAELLAPIARAIDYAHRRGVLHRDLKPSNILIDREGRPHVADFGLAKRIGAESGLTYTGAIVGTPSFMAPEQAAGARGRIGPASDVYGLGAILYQMLTGRPPFQAASALDTLLLVREQDPLPPRLLNPRVDRDLEMIALRCLQKPPDLRYPSAAALADDLDAYLAGEPVSARTGRLSAVVGRALRETHHAAVLENWGLLWMWHSLVVLVLCLITNGLQLRGVTSAAPYVLIWTVGLGTWGLIFWALRRRAGPVTFVERQIAHLWASSMAGCTSLFAVEMLMGLPVLTLSPVLALFSGMVFLGKAGVLSGALYLPAAALFFTSGLMALFPRYGLTIFGVVSAACFFVPGLQYHLRRIRAGPPRKKSEAAG